MTAKHDVIKKYHRKETLTVMPKSMDEFLAENSNTLEHVITYNHQKMIVECKPPHPRQYIKDNYQNMFSY